MSNYAIIETGGKQYRVEPGDVIDVERLPENEPGDTLEIEKVLLLNQDGDVSIGQPYVEDARVIARIESEGRGEKVVVFKYKPKIRYRRKKGHRQRFARLTIEEVGLAKSKTARRAKAGSKG